MRARRLTALTWRETVPAVSPTGRFLVEPKTVPVRIYRGRTVGKSTDLGRYARPGYVYHPINYTALEMRLMAELDALSMGCRVPTFPSPLYCVHTELGHRR